MTEVAVKTLPRAETEETLLVMARDHATSAQAMTAAMGSFADVSGAAYLPAGPASRVGELPALGGGVTALRVEGVAPSVAHRKDLLAKLVGGFGKLESLSATASRGLWRAIRDVAPFAAGGPLGERYVWRISTAPARGVDVGRKLAEAGQAESFCDWAGGLIWAALPPADDAGAAVVRAVVGAAGGHATLIRAPAAVRAKVDVFEPQNPALDALTKRVREGFDPRGVLNAGRMWAGV
jgi:glycolate oxidase FAD binding subunit